ncbi:cupin domain-containing protein [Heyndrickxia coagulans]|uniref:cupin domain-containing protein n=1 Tax=Heyndrickxia coagulans TaxID=1398 RepID=UPI00215B89A8|nr:cupin domain-containing protein [Heyndrickxia coagulans]
MFPISLEICTWWCNDWNPHYYNWNNNLGDNENPYNRGNILKDFGPQPFVINIEQAAKKNNNFRIALWTGNHLEVTLMNIGVGEDIGLEIHPTLDQFLRIEDGQGLVQMGKNKGIYDFQANVYDDYVIVIPAGTWHNLTNTGNKPIKLYSIYAPPQHPYGTVHETKAIAMASENHY